MKSRKLLWAALLMSLITLMPAVVRRIDNENNNKSVILAGEFYGNEGNIDAVNKEFKTAGVSALIIPCEDLINENNTPGSGSNILDRLTASGYSIIFQLKSLSHTTEFYSKLDFLVSKYNVKYLLAYPDTNGTSNAADTINKEASGVVSVSSENRSYAIKPLLDIIKARKLIIFLMENREQTGYYKMPGLDQLIPGSGYEINRAFSIGSSLLKDTEAKDPVPVWQRAVVDRNIRLIAAGLEELGAINTTNDPATGNRTSQIARPLPIQKLEYFLGKKGFYFNTAVKAMDPGIPGISLCILAIINLAAAIMLCISYLPDRGKLLISALQQIYRKLLHNKSSIPESVIPLKSKILLFITFAIILAYTSLAIFIDKGILLAFTSAIVYPSLSGLLILNYLQKSAAEEANYIKKISGTLFIMLAASLAGAIVIAASMSDIRYLMHLVNFNPVTPAYIVPLILFAVNFAAFHKDAFSSGNLYKYFKVRHIVKIIAYFIFLTAVLYIYLARDGNSGITYASGLELQVRDMLEAWLYARPRTKEYLIGYPCLFIFSYLYIASRPTITAFTAGFLSIITGVSILNSFCHGFTPFMTSAARSAEGLLAGMITGSLAVAVTALTAGILNSRYKTQDHKIKNNK